MKKAQKRLLEIQKRKKELREQIDELTGEELDEVAQEVEKLDEEEKEIEEETEKRSRLMSSLFSTNPVKSGSAIEKPRQGVSTEKRSVSELIASAEYRSAFFKKFAGTELSDIEQRALSTAKSSMGVAVPTITMNKVFEKLREDAIVYPLVTVSNLRGNVSIPVEDYTADVSRLSEGETVTVSEDTLDELLLGAKKYIKAVKLTCELANTSIDALEEYLVTRLSEKLMEAVDYDIINGDGKKCAKGIIPSVTPIKTKTAGKFVRADIQKLFASLPAKAKKGAVLMMSTDTLYDQVQNITDNNGYPIYDDDTNKIKGREVVECDDVPNGVIIFGRFDKYMFNWSKDAVIEKSSEIAFLSGDEVFRILALADGGLLNVGGFVVMDGRETEEEETEDNTPTQGQG